MKKTTLILSLLLVVLAVKESFTNSGGPQQNNAGVPGGGNCTGCHAGVAQTNASQLSLSITQNGNPVSSITAGQTYSLTFTISTPGNRFGFQMAARNPATNLPSGSFTAGTGSSLNGSFINQNNQGLASSTGQGRSWTFNWTAPAAAGFGSVTFYAAGMRANQNSQNTGDVTYLNSFNFPETIVVQPGINPNTATSIACDSAQVSFDFSTVGNFNPNNNFELQLSDIFGNFTNTTPLGVINSTGGSNLVISGTLPQLNTGNYLLRVVSTSPIITSNNRQIAVTQLQPPTIVRLNNNFSINNPAPNHSYQWFKNGNLIPNATSNNLTPTVFGAYAVRATNSSCPSRFLFSPYDTLQPVVAAFTPVAACSPSSSTGPLPISGGEFDTGNNFSVELSDATGQFTATPVTIFSAAMTVIPTTISGNFPAGLTPSTNYRLRFRSTQPAWTSNPSTAFQILAVPSKPSITRVQDTLVSSSTMGNQWYRLGQGMIPNATSQKFKPTQSGQYWVITSNVACSSPNSDTIAFVGTNIEALLIEMNMYPNPTNQGLVMECNQPVNLSNLSLIDLSGKQVFPEVIKRSENSLSVNTAQLPAGIYLVQYLHVRKKLVVVH